MKEHELQKLAGAAVLSVLTGQAGGLYEGVRKVIFDGGLENEVTVKEWEIIRTKTAHGYSAITETRID